MKPNILKCAVGRLAYLLIVLIANIFVCASEERRSQCASPLHDFLTSEHQRNCGPTDLMRAAYCGDDAKVRALIQAGAEVNAESRLCPTSLRAGDSLSPPRTAMGLAAMEGHVKVVRELLSADGNPNVALSWALVGRSQGDTGDHGAVVRDAIEAGANVWEALSRIGLDCGPLTIATVHGGFDVVRALLENGIGPDESNTRRCNPASLSFSESDASMTSFVTKLARRMGLPTDWDSKSFKAFAFGGGESGEEGPHPRSGGTALMWAAALGDEAVVELLLRAGASASYYPSESAKGVRNVSARDWALEGSHSVAASLLASAELLQPSCASHQNLETPIAAIEGYFVREDVKSRLFFVKGESACDLHHEVGKATSVVSGSFSEFVGVCRDPETGLDWALVHSSMGAYSDIHLLSVASENHSIRVEYTQAWTEWNSADYGKLVQDGKCLGRILRKNDALFEAAIAAIRPGLEEVDIKAQKGEIPRLSPRRLQSTEVERWLRALAAMRPSVARFESARYSTESSREKWTVVQVLGIGFAPGVVLVRDHAKDTWHAIYAVQPGASKAFNYPMSNMVIVGDELHARICTSCQFWGEYGSFGINLRTHRIYALHSEDELSEVGNNVLIEDIGKVF